VGPRAGRTHRHLLVGSFLALAAAVVPAGAAPDPPAEATIVFRNVRLFDGETVVSGAQVEVRGSLIARVGKSAKPPKGAVVIDGAGRSLLPGLIDSHAHVFGTALRDALVMGVTTELDMFSDPATIAAFRREGPEKDLADVRSAGVLVTAPKGHGTQYGMPIPTITSPNEAQPFVDARIAEGSDYIKIVFDDGHAYGLQTATLDEPTLKAVIDAAHRRDKLAIVHVGDLAGARVAVKSGADGLAHLFVDEAPDPGFGKLVASRKAFVIPTLTVLESVTWRDGGARLSADPRIAEFVSLENLRNLGQTFPRRPNSPPRKYEAAVAAIRELKTAGVPLLAGSDAPNPGTAHGASLHRELELLVEAGLTPTEALRSATSVPARAFGLRDRGRLAKGMRADLLLVEGNPAADIRSTRAIVGVWKAGVGVDREGYRREVADAKVAFANAASAPAPEGSESGIVSDFDGGEAATRFGAGWSVTTDEIAGGKSTATMKVAEGGAEATTASLSVAGSVAPGLPYAWAGVLFSPGRAEMAPVNLSSKSEIRFWAKGDGSTYRVMLFSQSRGGMPLVQTFAAGEEWKEFVFPLRSFEGFDGRDLTGVVFGAGPSPGEFAFQIDGVRFQ
jgi:imidazolonepropionase-like amidohydrolase